MGMTLLSNYSERGRQNPFDAYMAGFSMWMSPRQILIVEEALKSYIPKEGIYTEAYSDLLEMVSYEADIKRKKYLEN